MHFSEKIRRHKNKTHKAFSLLEVLIVLSILSIVVVSFYRTFASGTNLIIEAKRKVLATGVATQRIEDIRGLDYGLIGTDGGNPSGTIDPDEFVISGEQRFHVKTYIVYVDDPDDGLLETGDSTPNDYKKVQVDVSWGEERNSQKVSFTSNFAPTGTEADIGGGTLIVNVIDVDGIPVANASVNIFNNTVFPVVDQDLLTDANGNVSIPSTEVSDQNYKISVSKSGYESVATLPPYPTTSYYPSDIHASVVDGMVTNSVITIGEISDLELHFKDPHSESVGDVDFNLEGGRVMGIEDDGITVVYNYSESLECDASGDETISSLSPGSYKFTITETGYTTWKSDNVTGDEPDEIILPQGQLPYSQDIIILDDSMDSYFVQVVDSVTGNPIELASVSLENTLLGYSETVETDQYGYAFFPDDPSEVLVSGETYGWSVDMVDYNSESGSVTIDQLTEETAQLSPL